jgi:hypothetical protein
MFPSMLTLESIDLTPSGRPSLRPSEVEHLLLDKVGVVVGVGGVGGVGGGYIHAMLGLFDHF